MSVNFSCVNKLIRNKKPLSINILFHSHVSTTTAFVAFESTSRQSRAIVEYIIFLGFTESEDCVLRVLIRRKRTVLIFRTF